jgi:hypothetical protein
VVLAVAVGSGSFLVAWAATFTDQASVTANTFTTAASFGGCTYVDTGFTDPSAAATDTGGDNDGFELNPTNAFADGGGYASNINGPDDRHRFYNYGFSIDSACEILGIQVRLDWWLDSTSGSNSMSVELSWDGGTSWTAAKTDATETTSEHTGLLGSYGDTWGRTWSPADFSDANFRVRVTSNGANARDFFLDWVPVRVYSGPPGTTSTSLTSVADSYVKETSPDSNFGTETEMTVSGISGNAQRSFVRFDLSSIPAGSTIGAATLTLCMSSWVSDAIGRVHELHLATGSWTETGITWNNQPTVAASTTDTATVSLGCLDWAVTSDVQDWLDGTSNYGWRVKDSSESSSGLPVAWYYTRESSVTAERPELEVVYTPP